MKLFYIAAESPNGVIYDHFAVADSAEEAIVLIAKVYLEPETVDWSDAAAVRQAFDEDAVPEEIGPATGPARAIGWQEVKQAVLKTIQ